MNHDVVAIINKAKELVRLAREFGFHATIDFNLFMQEPPFNADCEEGEEVYDITLYVSLFDRENERQEAVSDALRVAPPEAVTELRRWLRHPAATPTEATLEWFRSFRQQQRR